MQVTEPSIAWSREIASLLILLVASFNIAIADEAGDPAPNKPNAAQLQFFEERIRPVLVEHCYSCHSAEAKDVRGGLLLDSRDAILLGGDSGPALVAGKPESSLLLEAMRHESLEMPPDRKLPDNILNDFETWIQLGAVDPREGGVVRSKRSIDIDKGREFWSFRPVVKPAVPEAGDGWAISDVDRFVAAARSEAANTTTLATADEATPETLIRRLSFVLIGLPPTLDEQKHFIDAWKANPETAMSTTVDRLLASPQFGEHWGRHWMDVARYAESTGGGRSMMLPDAWRFRDYVIHSFNTDKSFQQLVREHLAGDLLPASTDKQRDEQVIGAGYLMLGAINYEEQDKEQLRMDVVDEQIDSMGRSFLGMTLGCCRCHDHKFDPIPTTDYYALGGIFRSTKSLTPGNVCGFVTTPLRVGFDRTALDQWIAKNKELERQISELKKPGREKNDRPGAPNRNVLTGIITDDSEAQLEGKWVASSFQQPFVGVGYHHSDSPRTGVSARFETQLPENGEYVVRMVVNHGESRSDKVPVVVTHADGESTVTVNQKSKPSGDGMFAELGRFRFEAAQQAVVVVKAAEASSGFVIVDSIQFLPISLLSPGERIAASSQIFADNAGKQTELRRLEAERKQHAKSKPEIPTAMCVEDEKSPADWHVHIRGEIRNLGPVVPRGFITVATPVSIGPTITTPNPSTTSGRLELAEWVASSSNPLTARVYVNRIWQHLIGEGIVRTPDNFGETGERPSHPELLDFLAATFVEDDAWSTKRMVRRLCLSRTFRMSSSSTAEQTAADPDNRLLTHAIRRRLDAEAVRDSLLQIAGSLDRSVQSGRTIAKVSTYDNEYRHSMYPTNVRSVFVPSFRNTMLDLFEVFDGANPNLVSGKRTRSTRPAQALYMLNSPFVMQQAQSAAREFLKSPPFEAKNPDISVRNAWQICMSREPTPKELSAILTAIGERPISEDAWTEVFHAMFASVDFRYLE